MYMYRILLCQHGLMISRAAGLGHIGFIRNRMEIAAAAFNLYLYVAYNYQLNKPSDEINHLM